MGEELRAEAPLTTVAELLEKLQCEGTEELAALIDAQLDDDLVRLNASQRDLAIDLTFESVVLTFPISLNCFWRSIDEAEGRSFMRHACMVLESEIRSVEGFDFQVYPGTYPDGGNWPATGFPTLPDYPYQRAAPETWTYSEWVDKRLRRVLARAGKDSFDVDWNCPVAIEEADSLDKLRHRTRSASSEL